VRRSCAWVARARRGDAAICDPQREGTLPAAGAPATAAVRNSPARQSEVGDARNGLRTEPLVIPATALFSLAHVQNDFCVPNRVQIGVLGGISLLAELLDSSSADVQRQACLALNEACLKNMANSQQLCSCGAIRAIMHILDSGDPDLQTQALAVLGTSAVNSLEVRLELRCAPTPLSCAFRVGWVPLPLPACHTTVGGVAPCACVRACVAWHAWLGLDE
jgi:hypothetical protein